MAIAIEAAVGCRESLCAFNDDVICNDVSDLPECPRDHGHFLFSRERQELIDLDHQAPRIVSTDEKSWPVVSELQSTGRNLSGAARDRNFGNHSGRISFFALYFW
jgi:hypothetical protein